MSHRCSATIANDLFSLEEQFNFGVYCIATALGDFEDNTIASAQALVREGRLIGAPRDELGEVAPTIPDMPLAFDSIVTTAESPARPVSPLRPCKLTVRRLENK